MEQPKLQLPIVNFPKQQTIFDTNVRHTIVPKGRRFGLTRGAANDFIKCALKKQFQKGLWVDTVNANIERYVERYFMPALMKLPNDMWRWRKQLKILTIRDSFIDFRSADNPHNIEGFGYDKYFLNEAGIILRNEYLWKNAIMPMLWEYKNTRGVIGGTPKGMGTFYELYQRGLDKAQIDYAALTFTSFDNPYILHDVILDDIKTTPEHVVKQEIYAQFIEDTGVVFRHVVQIATEQPQEQKKDHIYVIGCDLAKVQDFTVMAVYDRKTNKQVFQMRFNKIEWPYQKKKIQELSKKYNDALVIIDSTGLGEPIYEDLAQAGVPIESYKFTNESKKQLIEKLSTYIELQHIRMLHDDDIINEFNAFTYDYSEKTGRVTYNAPVGFHDDIVFAHALAIWSLHPIIERKEEKMTLIQKDFYEKQKAYQEEQSGEIDILEYEAI